MQEKKYFFDNAKNSVVFLFYIYARKKKIINYIKWLTILYMHKKINVY